MKILGITVIATWLLGTLGCNSRVAKPAGNVVAGSSECRSCHPAFYKKWSTSHHGTAMQPFTPEFAAHLTPMSDAMTVGDASYRAMLAGSAGYVEERKGKEIRRLPILHAMGGKNVYYFLTQQERGRLQVLPLAYDVRARSWFDMAASGVRMHGESSSDAALPWTDPAFTFNASCYSCHVSQLRTNYDPASDSYATSWTEPGINCETCHGDAQAHMALFRNSKGEKPADIRILRTGALTTQQRNEVCAPCHAKISPISPAYNPSQRFFDHYFLVTLEDADYYPDGRDLGENYTYTSWMLSPCVRGGKFDCLHCHTSTGKYRFTSENPNGACQTCHADIAANVYKHARHKPGTPGSQCIDCHMPQTRFANMTRSDHSMLPPSPAATMKFGSPNACNLCHQDRTPAWADKTVRAWFARDYQKPVLERAALLDAARRQDWRQFPSMLVYIDSTNGEPVFKASLLRLIRNSNAPQKWPVYIRALRHKDPMVRAAAAAGLEGHTTPEARNALVAALQDDYRAVRISAAAALARTPQQSLPVDARQPLENGTSELLAAFNARPDNFMGQTNLGNFYMDRGDIQRSVEAFERAIRLRPDSVGTLVNASLAYSRAGRVADAERVLNQALRYQPDSAPANFNRGLLLAETGRTKEAENALRKALAADRTLAAAAYNLCVLLGESDPAAALESCRQATKTEPDVEKYTFTLAFYLDRTGQWHQAIETLEGFSRRAKLAPESQIFLADLYIRTGKPGKAATIFRALAGDPDLSEQLRKFALFRMHSLQSN